MGTNLRDLIDARFGVRTEPRRSPSGSQVGLAVSTILRADPRRLAATIINLSVNTIWISPFRNVSTVDGIRLGANGGSFTLIYDEDFDITAWEWFAIADGAASAVFTMEVLSR